MSLSLVSSLSWVPRGKPLQHPAKYALDSEELKRVSALARVELEDAKAGLEKAEGKGIKMMGDDGDDQMEDEDGDWEDDSDENEDDDSRKDADGDESMSVDEAPAGPQDPTDLSAYNLDNYDEEESSSAAMGAFSNIKGLTYYRTEADDPYITMKEEEEEDEREALEVLPTDNMLVIAKTEDEVSQLEVYIYSDHEENLFVHHDLMLPSFPLCLEWLDFPPAGPSTQANPRAAGNYIAVGTFEPEIEIWNLDTIDGLYPDTILGRPDKTKAHVPTPVGTGKKKKKIIKSRVSNQEHHVDAVLSLSWNSQHRSLLASASADKTVKLWDMSRTSVDQQQSAVRSFDVHSDKVQSVEWNKKELSTTLLTGSYDRTVRTWDTRSPQDGVVAHVESDVEALKWDPWDSFSFYVSLESGLILSYDSRTMSSSKSSEFSTVQPKFTISAHTGAASSLDISPHVKGCIATGGTDKTVKIWNVNEDNLETSGKRDVSLVCSRDLEVGKVFTLAFSPDDPLVIAASGSKAKLQVWDVSTNVGARKAFGDRLRKAGKELREARAGQGVIGVADDDEDSEDEGDME